MNGYLTIYTLTPDVPESADGVFCFDVDTVPIETKGEEPT